MPEFDLPPELENRLRALGEPVATFRTRLLALRIATTIAFLLGFALLVTMPVMMVFLPWQRLDWTYGLGVLPIGPALLAAGGAGVRRIRNTKGLHVIVFPNGLARLQGDSVEILRWQEISNVQRAAVPKSQYIGLEPARRLILIPFSGQGVEFDDSLSGLRRLRQLVEQYTLSHLFTEVLDACDAGWDYRFGEVKVNLDGLTYRGSHLPWSLCTKFDVVRGLLVIKKEGGWVAFCKIPANKVPNVHVLIAFAEYVRKDAT